VCCRRSPTTPRGRAASDRRGVRSARNCGARGPGILKGREAALMKAWREHRIRGLGPTGTGYFGKVKLMKPEASWPDNPEMYLLASRYRLV
jgi:hypothetical protein